MFSSDEVLELFEETQEAYAEVAVRGSLVGREGFHITNATRDAGIKTPQRKMYNRAYTTKALHEQIRQRILRGERPKMGGRGRPPTRWYRVAAELGIDLKAVSP